MTMPDDPMLAPWTGPLGGLPPLDSMCADRFAAAAEVAIDRSRRAVGAIATDAAAPDWRNVIEALGEAERPLRRLRALIDVARDTLATPETARGVAAVLPLLAAHDAWLWQDDALLGRLRALRAGMPDLPPGRRRLLDRLIVRFERGGTGLPPGDKAILAANGERMAALHAAFRDILIADEAATLVLSEAELATLPDELAAMARQSATARDSGDAGLIVSAPTMVAPFLARASDRGLRERAWRLVAGRGNRDPARSTLPLIREMLLLRADKAARLGFPSHAALVTADRMAGSPERAMALLARLWPAALAQAGVECDALQAAARADGVADLEPWDIPYYRERLRRDRLGTDEAALSRYLAVDAMRSAVFAMAERLYDLRFEPLDDAPRHHPDVTAFIVSRGGRAIGLLYLDLFARPGKQGGAWVMPLREAERGRVLPVVMIVHNVAPPPPGKPARMRLWDAVTLFHEFGHALHALLSGVEDRRQGLLDIVWDFVELPSTLKENWFPLPELLQRFAIDPETGEAMPPALIEALGKAVSKSAIETVQYLSAAILDLRLHGLAEPPADLPAFEAALLDELGLPAALRPIHPLSAFRHLFGGGEPTYSAGYYVYIWAETMSADIAEAFARAPGGMFDRAFARTMEERLLAVGDAVAPEQAFRDLMGRDPDPAALLRARGLIAA